MINSFKGLLFLIYLFLGLTNDSFSQNIPVGSWRSHADLSNVNEIEFFANKLFCRSENGIFYYDLEDESINKLSTIDGLSGTTPTAIYQAPKLNLLIIGFDNGSIDFINDRLEINSFKGISQADLVSNKQINHISSENGMIYLSTSFGLVVFDYNNFSIKETYDNLSANGTPLAIKHSIQTDGKLYLSTSSGMLIGEANGSVNLKDFRNWDRLNIPDTTEAKASIAFQGSIFMSSTGNNLYRLVGNSLELLQNFENKINRLSIIDEQLVCCSSNKIFEFDGNSFEMSSSVSVSGLIQDVVVVASQQYVAHSKMGLSLLNNNTIAASLIPNGPKGKLNLLKQLGNYTLYLSDEKVGFSFFNNGGWSYVGKDSSGKNLPFFKDALIELTTGNAILLSENEGPFAWDTREISAYSGTYDSSIVSWEKLATNPFGELYALTKTQISYALYELGSKNKIELGVSPSINITDYEIVFNGDHYIGSSNGLIIYNQQVDSVRVLSSASTNGNLPSNKVTDLALNLSGDLWIGTNNGVSYLSNFNGVFNQENVNVVVPIFEGFFLFQGININSLNFDGGDRLWVGNRDGLWTFDKQIQSTEQRFTQENSPLNTNNVQQFIINQLNGELFIKTAQQLISYRSASSQAQSNFDEVKVFPNPVSNRIHDRVSITGLAFNSEVKITDLAGNLIYKEEANGGTFSWQLTNYNGFKVKPGVYLVFAINDLGDESFRTKFVVTK